jgi:hypothetical protein
MPLALYLAAEQCGRDRLAQIEGLNQELGEKFEHITALETALGQRDIKHQEVLDRVVAERNRALADVEHFRRAFKEASMERRLLQQELTVYRDANRLVPEPTTFREAIQHAINRFSKESGSDTPDFILSAFLCNVLGSFDTALKSRTAYLRVPDDAPEMTGTASPYAFTAQDAAVQRAMPPPPQDMDGSEPSRFGG